MIEPTIEQVQAWLKESETAYESALWEFCPREFRELAEAYINERNFFNLEEIQAISDLLHDRKPIRFNPDDTWTAEKMLTLRNRIDTELALMMLRKIQL